MQIELHPHPQSSVRKPRGFSRRELLSGASLAAIGLVTAGGLAEESTPPAQTTEPKPDDGSNALDDFIFDIEHSSEGWHGTGGSAMEATVEEFPLSQSIAGVSMRL